MFCENIQKQMWVIHNNSFIHSQSKYLYLAPKYTCQFFSKIIESSPLNLFIGYVCCTLQSLNDKTPYKNKTDHSSVRDKCKSWNSYS